MTKKSTGLLMIMAVSLVVIPMSILMGSIIYGYTYAKPHIPRHTVAKPKVAKPDHGAYTSCVMCHGSKGEGLQGMSAPRLEGQSDWYLKDQLMKFKNNKRGSHPDDSTGKLMASIAATLANEAAVDAVVAYIQKMPPIPEVPESFEGNAENGKMKYMGCMMCHGQNGEGNPAMKAPKLRGQSGWYLQAQLHKFKTGQRGTDPSDPQAMQMAMMAKQFLPQDTDVADVVAYIMSLKD